MAEEQKNDQKEFKSFCAGMPFADMVRKMMESKKPGAPFNCVEIMSQMMKMCGGEKKEKEPAPESA